MDEILEQVWNEMIAELRAQAAALGEELEDAVEDAAEYATGRARHLAQILVTSEPGFAEAMVAERDNVALYAGLATVDRADELDERIRSSLTGALTFAARVLAALA